MEPLIGQIMLFGGNFAPRGWAFCDGQLVPIESNESLFAILGTSFGGDGRVNFALPDLRGRVPVHVGAGTNLTPRKIGEKTGTEQVTLKQTQMPAHSHELLVAKTPANSSQPCNDAFGQADIYAAGGAGAEPSIALHAKTIGEAGGTAAHDNMQPSLCINYIIALQGIFPSRN